MEQFPTLTNGQVALLRAELTTGYVLDESLTRVIGDSQKVYTVFDNYEDALAFANKLINDNKIECVIYDTDKTVLKYLHT